ncbi:hypothetical protein GTY87_38805 [Streptomyces sp. SID7813]|uniref:Uncharacterized protein n=1 Tax=Streptomyces coelicolor (strain ATCC BAA-471 / A3(2) / M145) TaxID=100226 RepID=Q9EWI6_STRCO|nr:hypothetical protein [Streptomyces sp. SID7813]QFI47319.1 hypothetical protein FQ762_39170 [Streptomyces coelicolor A3(2)]THA98450.1 hypothetical protein E6R61_07190 [Streptomyces sp. LRa12]CAC16519.1 hypothetical protein SC7H9.10 [Streptomyces coelicolor A3(2)]
MTRHVESHQVVGDRCGSPSEYGNAALRMSISNVRLFSA